MDNVKDLVHELKLVHKMQQDFFLEEDFENAFMLNHEVNELQTQLHECILFKQEGLAELMQEEL